MKKCDFCHNPNAEEYYCPNCGHTMGYFQVQPLYNAFDHRMVVTDRYLIFDSSASIIGGAAAAGLGGLVGSAIYEKAKKKSSAKQIGILDLRTVAGINVYLPASKMTGGAIHIFFRNGTDLVLAVLERGFKNKNLSALVDIFRGLNLTMAVYEVQTLPKLKTFNPFVSNHKDLLKVVSRSATAFIEPFPGMIVVD